jgi:hypothetical protein
LLNITNRDRTQVFPNYNSVRFPFYSYAKLINVLLIFVKIYNLTFQCVTRIPGNKYSAVACIQLCPDNPDKYNSILSFIFI